MVVVTGPGPGSGKLATCLSQLYHDHKKGIKSGYAKFETFPIWNIPVKHPVPTPGDEMGLKRLGVNLTSEPNFSTKNLFIS
jgi:uncharacterized protein (UPF0371 family)